MREEGGSSSSIQYLSALFRNIYKETNTGCIELLVSIRGRGKMGYADIKENLAESAEETRSEVTDES